MKDKAEATESNLGGPLCKCLHTDFAFEHSLVAFQLRPLAGGSFRFCISFAGHGRFLCISSAHDLKLKSQQSKTRYLRVFVCAKYRVPTDKHRSRV